MFQQILLFLCVSVSYANIEEIHQKQFYVISTTQSPHESQNNNNLLKQQLEFCSKMEDTNRRLSTIESQMLQTQKSLDDEKSRNEKLSQEVIRLNKILTNEQKNHQECMEKFHLHDEKIAALEKATESQQIAKICKDTREQSNYTENEKVSQELTRIETLLSNAQRNYQQLIDKLQSYDQKVATVQKLPESLSKAKNCKEIQDQGNHTSDVYVIKPKSQAFEVFCDMETRGGGWIVFQKRFDGSQDFNLVFKEYQEGFGNFSREFWLGLEYLHQLTSSGNNELLIELVDRNRKKAFAIYSNFNIANEREGYALKSLGSYKGTAGDSFTYHVGGKFRTKDTDGKCATRYGGAWWFINCLYSNLNGEYIKSGIPSRNAHGINWHGFSTDKFSLLEAKMMIRPI